MRTLQKLKTRLIDSIMNSENELLLSAIEDILSTTQGDERMNLTSEQSELLRMSENDIEKNRLISEDDLLKQDEEWMK